MSWLWNGDESNSEDRIDFITMDLAVGSLVAASDPEVLTGHGLRAIVDASDREEGRRRGIGR